jgi:hypothetical protein
MDAVTAIGAVNGSQQLTADEMAEVAELAARDREVRIHEAQHAAAAGGMAGGIEYDYERGPDGKMYAVGGKVRITVTPGQTPEETLAKARQLRAAADAPADPSGQDLAVAAKAGQMEAEALQKIAQKSRAAASHASGSRLPPSLRGLDRKA